MAIRLYQSIEDFCARGGEALVIVDYNRGQRSKLSSRKFLSEIKLKYPGQLRLKVFHLQFSNQRSKNFIRLKNVLKSLFLCFRCSFEDLHICGNSTKPII